MDKYDIAEQTSAIPVAHFSGNTAIQIKREIQASLKSKEMIDFRGRILFMYMFNDREYRKPGNEQTRLETQRA